MSPTALSPTAVANAVVLTLAALAVLGAWAYLRRWRLALPPMGVMNGNDVVFMLAAIVLMPLLYLRLPVALNTVLLTMATASLSYALVEPLTHSRALRWAVTLLPAAADVTVAWRYGTDSTAFMVINDALILLTVIGVCNLWVQGGMKAWHLAIQGGALVIYDFIATARMTVTVDMMNALARAPFAPQLVWRVGQHGWTGYGLGDLLMAAAFPLAMRKGYGRTAGVVAAAFSMVTLTGVMLGLPQVLAWVGAVDTAFPTMVVLGPLMVLQLAWWRWRRGPERRMKDYWSEAEDATVGDPA